MTQDYLIYLLIHLFIYLFIYLFIEVHVVLNCIKLYLSNSGHYLNSLSLHKDRNLESVHFKKPKVRAHFKKLKKLSILKIPWKV